LPELPLLAPTPAPTEAEAEAEGEREGDTEGVKVEVGFLSLLPVVPGLVVGVLAPPLELDGTLGVFGGFGGLAAGAEGFSFSFSAGAAGVVLVATPPPLLLLLLLLPLATAWPSLARLTGVLAGVAVVFAFSSSHSVGAGM
jgi:hypothetical protein